MAGRILVVSPPTIDYVERECRAGGPGLYAGATASFLGWRAEAVGPMGYATVFAVEAEESLGVVRLGYMVDGPGFLFRLEYRGGGRIVRQVGVPRVLDPGAVLRLARGYYDAVLVSPVYGEEPGVLPPLLAGRSKLVAVDVQGYYRLGLGAPGGERLVSLTHSGEEEGKGPSNVLVDVVTRGYGTITVYYRGGRSEARDPRGLKLKDPTGAGDSFTAALLVLLAEGYSVEDAVEEASEVVGDLLPSIQSEARLDCGLVKGILY